MVVSLSICYSRDDSVGGCVKRDADSAAERDLQSFDLDGGGSGTSDVDLSFGSTNSTGVFYDREDRFVEGPWLGLFPRVFTRAKATLSHSCAGCEIERVLMIRLELNRTPNQDSVLSDNSPSQRGISTRHVAVADDLPVKMALLELQNPYLTLHLNEYPHNLP